MLHIKALLNSPSRLKNREKGRRAFILANGHSIAEEDLSKLKGELVIGMNASTMLEKKHNFVSSYYVLSDMRFLNHPEKRRWATMELHRDTVRVVRSELREYDEPNLEHCTYYVRALKRNGFSHNLSRGFYYGCTTSMLAIQLAYYLGCNEIYLLGMDLRYLPESPRFYDEDSPQQEDIFTSVQIWNIVNAYAILRKENKMLINCSSRSLLRAYLPFKHFKEVLEIR